MVSDILNDYLLEHNYKLYDVSLVKEYGELILRVLVDNDNGITVDELALINEYLSERIDDDKISDKEYMIEVSSPGAEKILKTLDDIKNSVGKYVNVTDINNTYEGYLIDVSDDLIELEINIKGRIKKIKIKLEEIKEIRLAIKF